MEKIKGVIEEIIYDNDDNGFKVCAIDTGEEIAVVRGTMPFLNVGEYIVAEGNWDTHNVYGLQFIVKNFDKQLPTATQDIKTFLASGIIAGIGPSLAGAIVDKFGKDTFNVIMFQPERLEAVRGITAKKVAKISEAFMKHKESSEVVTFFSRFGIGTSLALKAYRIYGADTIAVVSENPYVLAEPVDGIGYRTADKIAMDLGFSEDSRDRVMSCILFLLSIASGEGHVCYERDKLFLELRKNVVVSEDSFEASLKDLERYQKIRVCAVNDVAMVYLRYMYEAERYIEARLMDLADQEIFCDEKNVEKNIKYFEKEHEIKLADRQKEAVRLASKSGMLVITGGPGTGKTTIIKAIMRIIMAEGGVCFLAAPTGRAAKRMSLACGAQAKTIHRLLEIDYSKEREGDGSVAIHDDRNVSFKRNEKSPLKCDALIVDESSMVDTLLMFHLLKAVKSGTRLILVGDKDQLPSVGAGKVLRDIIECDLFETAMLDEIYRQNAKSLITVNAHSVNRGKMPEMNDMDGDFFLMVRHDTESCMQTLKELCKTRLPKKYGIDPMTDIQVIMPNRRGACGSVAANAELQSVLNPQGFGKKEIELSGVVFREGDRVMQVRNNYDLVWENVYNPTITGEGVFNGEMGVISAIDMKNRVVSVVFDDSRLVFYEYSAMRELEHSYAITVHKSQGSEFDYCIIPIVNVTPMLMTRNLLYTAITRAKKLAVILGTKENLKMMIDNDSEVLRYTGLFKSGGELF